MQYLLYIVFVISDTVQNDLVKRIYENNKALMHNVITNASQ